jgi:copper chaperone
MMTEQVFRVDGLHCQSCVGAVKDALGALEAVSVVEVELGEPSVVTVQTQHPLSVDEVAAALREEGDYAGVG